MGQETPTDDDDMLEEDGSDRFAGFLRRSMEYMQEMDTRWKLLVTTCNRLTLEDLKYFCREGKKRRVIFDLPTLKNRRGYLDSNRHGNAIVIEGPPETIDGTWHYIHDEERLLSTDVRAESPALVEMIEADELWENLIESGRPITFADLEKMGRELNAECRWVWFTPPEQIVASTRQTPNEGIPIKVHEAVGGSPVKGFLRYSPRSGFSVGVCDGVEPDFRPANVQQDFAIPDEKTTARLKIYAREN